MSSGEHLDVTAPVSLGQALPLQPTVGASRVGRP